MLLPISSRAACVDDSIDDDDDQASSTVSKDYIVSEVANLRVSNYACSDFFALRTWLIQETQRRALAWDPTTRPYFPGVTAAELMDATVPVSNEDALTSFFHLYPTLCVDPSNASDSPPCGWESYILIPLDEIADLGRLAAEFVPQLRQHLREFGESDADPFSAFTFFTALYIITQCCTSLGAYFSHLYHSNVDLPLLQRYTAETLSKPFCGYQVLRWLANSVKNGFEFMINVPEAGGEARHHMTAIRGLHGCCHGMLTIQKMAVRLTLSIVKLTWLSSWSKMACSASPLSASSLIDYHYRNGGDANHLCAADLLSVRSSVELSIAPFEQFSLTTSQCLKEAMTVGTGLSSHKAMTLREAVLAEKDLHALQNSSEMWLPWNWGVPTLNVTTRSMLEGRLAGKKMINEATSIFTQQADKEDVFLALSSAGRSFPIRLPADFMQYLNNQGRLTVTNHSQFASETAVFQIFCDARTLSWNWMTRLADLYKLSPIWNRDILFEYLAATLEFASAPSFEEICSAYLKPLPDETSLLINVGLDLEHVTP